MRFGHLPLYLADRSIEKIHRNEFRFGDNFTYGDRNLLLRLENYSKMTPNERNANPAERMKMLEFAQDIECLSLDTSFAVFEMQGVTLKKVDKSVNLFIELNTELNFPETVRDLSLCLTPTGSLSEYY